MFTRREIFSRFFFFVFKRDVTLNFLRLACSLRTGRKADRSDVAESGGTRRSAANRVPNCPSSGIREYSRVFPRAFDYFSRLPTSVRVVWFFEIFSALRVFFFFSNFSSLYLVVAAFISRHEFTLRNNSPLYASFVVVRHIGFWTLPSLSHGFCVGRCAYVLFRRGGFSLRATSVFREPRRARHPNRGSRFCALGYK